MRGAFIARLRRRIKSVFGRRAELPSPIDHALSEDAAERLEAARTRLKATIPPPEE